VTSAPEVIGDDAVLAGAVHGPNAGVRFVPDDASDLARALGIVAGHSATAATTVDVLVLGDDGEPAVNMVVLGPPPDRLRRHHRARECVVEVGGRTVWEGRATTVVIANGEYLRGKDVVPRGHPADGHFEVHVYALAPGQRATMRARLATGTHVPHPEIRTAQGTEVRVRWSRPARLEIDGSARGKAKTLQVGIRPGALTLLP
jgi:hypothetical protein